MAAATVRATSRPNADPSAHDKLGPSPLNPKPEGVRPGRLTQAETIVSGGWPLPLHSVLVAIDRSFLAHVELSLLRSLRLDPEAVVVLAHAVPMTASPSDRPLDPPDGDASPYATIEAQLEAYQAELPCRSLIEIVKGDPAEEIVRLAHLYRAELVIMGRRGLSGIDRVLRGSVSTAVIERAPCSVLVVKEVP